MPPRYPRPATPTVPPPAERLVKRVETWKAILGVLITAAGIGAAAVTLAASKADVAELHQVRDGAAAQLGAAQAGTSAQLGALQSVVQDLRMRQAAVDASLQSLTDDMRFIRSQLIEIAKSTGARRVPAPQP